MFNATKFMGTGFQYSIRGTENTGFVVTVLGRKLGWYKTLALAQNRVEKSFKVYMG